MGDNLGPCGLSMGCKVIYSRVDPRFRPNIPGARSSRLGAALGSFPDRPDNPFIQALTRRCRRDDCRSMVGGIKADIELSGKLPARFNVLFPAHLQIDGQ